MSQIVLDHVEKVYSGGVKALDDLNLEVREGEFMVLVGPGGTISIGSQVVNDLPKAEIKRRVGEAAAMLGLEPYLNRKPAALSGGQRQRVAMGRSIVREPQAFLMDEPLSNLHAKLRVSMRAALNQLHERLGITTVYVTHDQVEAMTLGDRVCVMRDGRIDDPAFLMERARLRGRLEHRPENAVSRAELEWLYEAMTEEFLRRARIAWTSDRPRPPTARRRAYHTSSTTSTPQQADRGA